MKRKEEIVRVPPDGTVLANDLEIESSEYWLGVLWDTTRDVRTENAEESIEGTLWIDSSGVAITGAEIEERLERKLLTELLEKYTPPGVRRYVVDVANEFYDLEYITDFYTVGSSPSGSGWHKRRLYNVLKGEFEPPVPGYIYLMASPVDSALFDQLVDGSAAVGYKIGMSKDPQRRLREVSRQSFWNEVELLHTIKCSTIQEAYKIEAGIHWALADRRSDEHEGQEWYNFNDPDGQALLEALQQVEDADGLKAWAVDALMLRKPYTRDLERLPLPGEQFSWEGILWVDKPISRDHADAVLFDHWNFAGNKSMRDSIRFPKADERLRASEPTPQGG